MDTSSDRRILNALKTSSWLQEAQKQLDSERLTRRRELLLKIEQSNETYRRVDAALVARADPIEKKLTAHRAEVAALEAKFEPLARERISSMCINTEEVRLLQLSLRNEAGECAEMLRVIDNTRCEIASNSGGQRAAILHDGLVPTTRIAAVLALLLAKYREVERIAVEEADVSVSLDRIRRQIAEEGIRLIDRL